VVGAATLMTVLPAQAQSNLDAGKSPAQIFADTCNACHRSARELRQTNARFLLEHYTTGGQEAAAMAAYLASVGSAVQQRRPSALGAGQAGTTAARRPQPASDQGRQPETQTALPATTPGRRSPAAPEHSSPDPAPAATLKPRRPSESVEAGTLPVDAAQGRIAEAVAPQAASTAPMRPTGPQEFEE
jgi:hypothetical protein